MIGSRQLQVLSAVIRWGSVTRAARELSLAQPTVSKTIRRLEDLAGMRLFERMEGRLRPTTEAVILAREADRVGTELASFERLLTGIREHRGGTLRIAAPPGFSSTIIPRAIMEMTRRVTEVRPLLSVAGPPQILEEAVAGKVDIGVVHYTEEEPMATAQPIASGRIVCVMPREHRLARGRLLTPERLEGEAIVAYQQNLPFARAINDRLLARVPNASLPMEINFSTVLLEFVRLGAGIGLVDEFFLWFDPLPDIAVRSIEPPVEVIMAVVHARSRPLPTAARVFIDCLRETVELGRRRAPWNR